VLDIHQTDFLVRFPRQFDPSFATMELPGSPVGLTGPERLHRHSIVRIRQPDSGVDPVERDARAPDPVRCMGRSASTHPIREAPSRLLDQQYPGGVLPQEEAFHQERLELAP